MQYIVLVIVKKKYRNRDENGGISRWNMSGMMHLVKEAGANEGQHHTLRSTYYFW